MPQQRIDELPLAKRKEMAKKFNWTHGSQLYVGHFVS